MVKAFLHPRPGYVPKVPANVARSIMLQAFCPPPFQNADQERHNLLCPVQTLDAYVHRAALWRKNEQLFVCFGPPNKGSPASKQKMSKWVVEAISLAYQSAGQPSPMAVRSHSTRSMRPLWPLYQELLSKRFVMRQVGPHCTHSSNCILWTWTLPQVPKCSRPSAAR